MNGTSEIVRIADMNEVPQRVRATIVGHKVVEFLTITNPARVTSLPVRHYGTPKVPDAPVATPVQSANEVLSDAPPYTEDFLDEMFASDEYARTIVG